MTINYPKSMIIKLSQSNLSLLIFSLITISCKKEMGKQEISYVINKPFPQGINYRNCIKPTNVSQHQMNLEVVDYYTYWKSTYLKHDLNCLPGGYYVKGEITGDPEGFIPSGCSEGLGYGMIISVLMAGEDVEAKTSFDGLFKTARGFHSANNPYLMGWVVADHPKAMGHFNSATDGDMDIAYALLLAHLQWTSEGTINYLAEAKKMITNGLKGSNMTTGYRLNLGDWADKNALETRPSDWMMDHMRAFNKLTNDPSWLKVIDNLYNVYNLFSSRYSPTSGLISDFIINEPAEPAPANYLNEFPPTDRYYYNACRVPLRIAMDYAFSGSTNAYLVSNRIVNWIDSKTKGDPSLIVTGYNLNGEAFGKDSAMVFTAPFIAAAIINNKHQEFLNNGWSIIKDKRDSYFSDTYNLLCMLFISGNWWNPDI
ncbi:MAG: glycosyl hydrolase family 8 [Flavisolibacter sp.]